MSNPLTFTNLVILPLTLTLITLIYITHKNKPQPISQTNFTFYVHDYLTGPETSAATVAGTNGPSSHILNFGTILAVDDPITEGAKRDSKEIGRAQGIYINSQLDGKGLYLVFSVIFNDGKFKGSSLEIQGSDIFGLEKREFGVVSGTGFFRFVKGFGIMETEFMDIVNLRAVLKLNVTVKHY